MVTTQYRKLWDVLLDVVVMACAVGETTMGASTFARRFSRSSNSALGLEISIGEFVGVSPLALEDLDGTLQLCLFLGASDLAIREPVTDDSFLDLCRQVGGWCVDPLVHFGQEACFEQLAHSGMELADGVDLGIRRLAHMIDICPIDLSPVFSIQVLATSKVHSIGFGGSKVKGLDQVADSSVAELEEISHDLGSAFAISFFDERDDAVGAGEVVGVAPVDRVEGDIVVAGVVVDEVELDEDSEGVA